MSKFGWSLPPGCGKLPGEEDEGPCECCGQSIDDCICPSCPVCSNVGNPKCYTDHGIEKEPKQIRSLAEAEARWAEENCLQAEAEAKMEQDAAAFMKENEAYDLMKESDLQ